MLFDDYGWRLLLIRDCMGLDNIYFNFILLYLNWFKKGVGVYLIL